MAKNSHVAEVFEALISMLHSIKIAWKKLIDPCQKIPYVVILIDAINNRLSLDQGKTDKFILKLQKASNATHLSSKHLEKSEVLSGHANEMKMK